MTNFKYKAISINGEKVNGVIEAMDQMEAIAKIKQTCVIVEDIKEVQKSEYAVKRRGKVSLRDLSLLCVRFSIVLEVGIPIVQAVDMMVGQTEDKNLKQVLKEVSEDVAMGRSMAASFASKDNFFPVTFVETVRSGEESGELIKAFKSLSAYYDKSGKTRQKLVSSLMYPAFVVVVAIVVMAVIMMYAVPLFSSSFASSGTALPLPTRIVIGVSNFMIEYGIFLLFGLSATLLAAKLYSRTEKGGTLFSKALLSLPLLGKVVQLSAASQFAHTLSMMLAAGMPILKCIDASGKVVSSYVMRRDIREAAKGVEEGKTLGSCLAQSKYMPGLLVEMIIMGESTGTLESTLKTVGDYYDNEVEVSSTRAISVLEPAIICVLAGFVILVLFSVYLPIFSMYGSV